MIALACVISLSLVGCFGKKKTEWAYGPGEEWVDNMREGITDKIDDPVQATELLAVVDKIEGSLIDLDGDVRTYYKALTRLDGDYNSTREQFQKVIDDFNTSRHKHFRQLLGHLFEMKEIVDEDDWKDLSEMDKTLYESWQRTYGPLD